MLRLVGTPAAPGMASGPVVRVGKPVRQVRARLPIGEEKLAIDRAFVSAQEALAALMEAVEDDEAAGILAFQMALLDDDEITRPVHEGIAVGKTADEAWAQVMNVLVADYESSDDGYFRGRAADLVDLRDRVLDALNGSGMETIAAGSIVIADDLAPSRFLATDWNGSGIVLLRGGTTSHVAILARSRGVPLLVGVGAFDAAVAGEALLDSHEGVLVVNPDPAARDEFERRRAVHSERARADHLHLGMEAKTAGGERVQVMINVARPEELDGVDPDHVDGIGLVRTEFLFHDRRALPTEEEQYRVYRRVAEWARGKPVTIRTLDAGGDKPVVGVTHEGESNPFLGVRGVRLSLERPDVLMLQLRAIARAAVLGNVKVMVPMVAVPDELARVRAMLAEAVRELTAAGVEAELPPLGMMVEVPAAALAIETFDADFYSVGSNDLLQYLMAASRDEPALAALARPGPAFWRVLHELCVHGRATGREVSLCGDLASELRVIPELLRNGLRTLSVAQAALASVKAAISRV
jgi:phosphotransferase system enzyme I (PtsI)